jgi:hypothetical protein
VGGSAFQPRRSMDQRLRSSSNRSCSDISFQLRRLRRTRRRRTLRTSPVMSPSPFVRGAESRTNTGYSTLYCDLKPGGRVVVLPRTGEMWPASRFRGIPTPFAARPDGSRRPGRLLLSMEEFYRRTETGHWMGGLYKSRARAAVSPAAVRLGVVVLTLILLWSAIIALAVVAYEALS